MSTSHLASKATTWELNSSDKNLYRTVLWPWLRLEACVWEKRETMHTVIGTNYMRKRQMIETNVLTWPWKYKNTLSDDDSLGGICQTPILTAGQLKSIGVIQLYMQLYSLTILQSINALVLLVLHSHCCTWECQELPRGSSLPARFPGEKAACPEARRSAEPAWEGVICAC